ncbi:Uncharacterised protein [Mycobacteroides abscessus subsp. abscessus]|nr:Uncharacterised protein [Mycobacteroides abscessus subsp. abscessus]
MIDAPAPAKPRTDIAARRRGDAILAAMQAKRAYLAASDSEERSEFDEAHAVIERLTAAGFVTFDAPAPAGRKVAG